MQKIVSFALKGALTAVFFVHSAAGIAVAQELDFDGLQSKAEAGDVAAQRKLGEALVYGLDGIPKDAQAGKALLMQAANSGDLDAKIKLGTLLVDGIYLDADPDSGLELLEQAAAAGDVRAQTKLGIDRLWGINSQADPEAARSLLTAAAANGGTEAARVLGEGLIGGWVLDRDVDEGARLLDQAVQDGDTQAKITLGSFLLNGDGLRQNTARATQLFEDAAKDGNGEGLEQLGAFLMWEKRNARKGEMYLRRAGELGRTSAWETLAEGAMYGFLGKARGKKFNEFAQLARAQNSSRIEVLDAQRQMWGISMRASGPKTIAKLEDAASEGNKDAAKFLISLVRDGNQMNVRRQPGRASGYIEKYSDLLTPNETSQYELSIQAAKARSVREYKSIGERLGNWDDVVSDEFGKDLFAANPNLAIYLLQGDMKSRGSFKGNPSGRATKATIRAIVKECKASRISRNCKHSVVEPNVIGPLLARQFR
ncbi:tetratricopeptide repeat protein [Roseovarius sp. 2305UL8-3]|uniref:tetratricopeptide repeat protein n=1 Tax=Roseovarius conchicola TaxID=3121636 RepID=UPI00352952A5